MTFFGVASGALNAGSKLDPFLDALAESGSDGLRALAQIDRLAPEHGGPIDLSSYLPILDGCAQRGLTMCGGLSGWSALETGHSTYDDWAEYVRVAGELARAMGDSPAARWWEGPNETLHFKTDPDPSPARYMRLHVPMYAAVKTAAPHLIVMNGAIGGLSNVPIEGVRKPTSVDWFAECLKLGIRGHIDAGNHHPYSQTGSMRDSVVAQTKGAWYARELHRLDRSLLWVFTEFGWQTGGWRNPITPAEQASRLRSGMRWIDGKEWVDAAFWFNWQDQDTENPNNTGDWMGLIDGDGNPKPSYNAFVDYHEGAR